MSGPLRRWNVAYPAAYLRSLPETSVDRLAKSALSSLIIPVAAITLLACVQSGSKGAGAPNEVGLIDASENKCLSNDDECQANVQLTQAARTEVILRKLIAELQSGRPNYNNMEPAMAFHVQMTDQMQGGSFFVDELGPLGEVRSIDYQYEEQGKDVFFVTFENAGRFGSTTWTWKIALSPTGKIETFEFSGPPLRRE